MKTKLLLGSNYKNRNLIHRELKLMPKQEASITTRLSRSEKQPNAPNEPDLGKLLNDLATLQKIQKL